MTAEHGRRKLRALLIGHSYVSIEIAQKKARALAQLPDLEVEVVAPRRFFELGRWMDIEVPPADWRYRLHALPVGLPSIRGQRHAYFFARGLRGIVRRFRPDVIDLWEEAYTAVSTQVSLTREFHARGARLILSPSARVAKRQPLPFSIGERFVIGRCDFVVGRSPEVVDVMRAKGYRGPSTVIGHGIDLSALEPLDMDLCRRALDLPPGPLIVFLGRLVTDKGIDTLIDALQHVPSARLAIFGEGPEESSLRRLAARCGVDDRIAFRGPVPADRVAPVLNAGDVLAMPSRVERWGRVAIEALACGTPVVVGGDYLPTLVGSYGRVVPPDDPGALAAALTATLNEPMSERARRADADASMRDSSRGRRWHSDGGTPTRRAFTVGESPIRCAFLNHYVDWGGAEGMLLTLFEAVDRERVAPVLVVPGEADSHRGARTLGVPVIVVPVNAGVLR